MPGNVAMPEAVETALGQSWIEASGRQTRIKRMQRLSHLIANRIRIGRPQVVG